MALRLDHHRRVATAALLLCFVLGTMLVSARVGFDGRQDAARPDGEPVVPLGAGVTREVRSSADWTQAVAAAQPGDVIRIRATIPARLAYQGHNDGGSGPAPNGTDALPIVITADSGVWIDPGNQNSGQGALDIVSADHVHVVGVNVRNAQFGIRCLQCHGSPGHPVRIAGNQVTQIGHAGIHFGGHWNTHAPGGQALIENNSISYTGKMAAAYGEGIYIGYGGTEWIDTTSDVTVRGNDISFTGAEGVDIKPGTRNIVVESNMIHDLAPINGGAISAHYVNLTPNPHPNQLDQVVVRENRIWNLNLGGVPGANDWAIWVGHGGVDVVRNMIWGLRGGSSQTRAVRIRATQGFGPHPIRIQENTFWTARGWVAEGQPSGAANIVASLNRGVEPTSAEVVVTAAAFPGAVPALGAGGTADSGGGPGSSFGWSGGAPSPTAAPPAASPPVTAAPATTAPPTTKPPTTRPTTTKPPTTSRPTTTVRPVVRPPGTRPPTTERVPTTTTTAAPSFRPEGSAPSSTTSTTAQASPTRRPRSGDDRRSDHKSRQAGRPVPKPRNQGEEEPGSPVARDAAALVRQVVARLPYLRAESQDDPLVALLPSLQLAFGPDSASAIGAPGTTGDGSDLGLSPTDASTGSSVMAGVDPTTSPEWSQDDPGAARSASGIDRQPAGAGGAGGQSSAAIVGYWLVGLLAVASGGLALRAILRL